MKPIISGVIFSAAMMRSPSFSRLASSTTTTASPRAMAAIAFSIVVNGISDPFAGDRCEQALDVLGYEVGFEVDGRADAFVPQGRDGERVRDGGNVERAVAEGRHGEADPVDGDRALFDHVAEHLTGRGEREAGRSVGERVAGSDASDGIDVALDQVAAEVIGQAQRSLEVHRLVHLERAERGALQGLDDRVCGPPAVPQLD